MPACLWRCTPRYIGWTDVPLTAKGQEEAREAGRLLKAQGYKFDVVHTSYLKRSVADRYCPWALPCPAES
jgi:2,3-bisphosphoglycerate-dependent phosphoglycerate mutase